MNKKQFIKSKTSSKEELEKELNSLKYALCLVYSRLPMEDKNAIYNEMISSLDFNDRDLASHLNSFRVTE
ncbi:hypothetical protein FZ387_17730 [Salmonella enterica]|nr:hypothetical protein [Salmonella enterica subsp. enterica serovar Typhimurium]ECD3361671.1 hypothetical protein [Salmonella enterica subsp. enterica]ECQ3175508.1 hypothetical protein [Salmonella enterica]EEA5465337.1 hypothetical protein [Salmonella enterica subsp. enterica serovar Molade]EED3646286.1 hypothetical protein [Salmonella enterica subsp. enterica serovar Schwarzengrund]